MFDKNKVSSPAIPDDIVDVFFDFLSQSNTTVKKFYDVEQGVKLQVREVEETRPTDLKASLALFEKLYPQYFDQLTIEKLEKLRKDTGADDMDKFQEMARDMLKVKR